MSVLSKPQLPASGTLKATVLGREWSFGYNCYEVGHGWTPFCTQAACDIGVSAAKNAVPLYASLYLFTQLGVQRRLNAAAFGETLRSVAASSSFLAFNLFAGCAVSCLLRNSTDRYYYRVQCFFPGLISSYLALLLERPSRRPNLAFYMANLSSELLYKWAVHYRLLPSLKHGETLLFALGLGTYLHFVRVHGFGRDPVSTALRLLIGPQEAAAPSSRAVRIAQQQLMLTTAAAADAGGSVALCSGVVDSAAALAGANTPDNVDKPATIKQRRRYKLVVCYQQLQAALTRALNAVFGKHALCPHDGQSCVDYSLVPFASRFALGYLIKSALNVPRQIPLMRRSPARALANAFAYDTATRNFALFVATLVCVSRGTHCALRRLTNSERASHSFVAGGLAGLSMALSPKSTLATYVIWKCIEQYFFLAVKRGKIVRVNECIGAIYAVSVNVLLYTFALKPSFIRPSYMKFIDQLSDHRLHQVNRMVLDVFNTGASVGYEDFFPNLEPRFLSPQFHELVFNWLIAPF